MPNFQKRRALPPKCPSGWELDPTQTKLFPTGGMRFYCIKSLEPKCPEGYEVGNQQKIGAGFSYTCALPPVIK